MSLAHATEDYVNRSHLINGIFVLDFGLLFRPTTTLVLETEQLQNTPHAERMLKIKSTTNDVRKDLIDLIE